MTIAMLPLLLLAASLPHAQPAAQSASQVTYQATRLQMTPGASAPLARETIVRTFPDGTVFGGSLHTGTGQPATHVPWRYKGSFEALATSSRSGSGARLSSVNASRDAAGVAGKDVWVWSKGKLRWITIDAPPGFENTRFHHDDVKIHDSGAVSGTAHFDGKVGSVAWVAHAGGGVEWVGLTSEPYVWTDKTIVSRVIDVRSDGAVIGVSVPAPPGSMKQYIPPLPWAGRDAIGVGWVLSDGRYAEFSPSTTRKGATPLASPLGPIGNDRYLVRMASTAGIADASGRITPMRIADGFNDPSFELGPVAAGGGRFAITSLAGRGAADQEENKPARHWLVAGSRVGELRAPLVDVIGGAVLSTDLRVILDSGVVLGTVSRRETVPRDDSIYFNVAVKWTNGAPSHIRPPGTPLAANFHASVLHFDKPAGNRFIIGDQFVSTQPQTTETVLTSPRIAWIYDIQKDAVTTIAHPDHPDWSILPLAVSSNGTAFLQVSEVAAPPRFYTWSKTDGFRTLTISESSRSLTPPVLRIREILDDEGKRFIAAFRPDPPPVNRVNDVPYRRALHAKPVSDLFILER